MRIEDDNIPHITAQCARCNGVFDMKFHVECPWCHNAGIKRVELSQTATPPELQMYKQECKFCYNTWSQHISHKHDQRPFFSMCQSCLASHRSGQQPINYRTGDYAHLVVNEAVHEWGKNPDVDWLYTLHALDSSGSPR